MLTRYTLVAIISVFAICAVIILILYPQRPKMRVESIVPDRLDPMHVTDDEAWTNWDVAAEIYNPNVYSFSAEKIDLTLFFDKYPLHPAAFCSCEAILIGPRTKGKLKMKMRVPLYSAESGIPNLIGECMAKKVVRTNIFMKALYKVSKYIKLIFEIEFIEDLECG